MPQRFAAAFSKEGRVGRSKWNVLQGFLHELLEQY